MLCNCSLGLVSWPPSAGLHPVLSSSKFWRLCICWPLRNWWSEFLWHLLGSGASDREPYSEAEARMLRAWGMLESAVLRCLQGVACLLEWIILKISWDPLCDLAQNLGCPTKHPEDHTVRSYCRHQTRTSFFPFQGFDTQWHHIPAIRLGPFPLSGVWQSLFARTQVGEFENCRLLLVDKKISTARDIVGILEAAVRGGFSLLIMAEDIEQEALATMVVNKLRGTLKVRPYSMFPTGMNPLLAFWRSWNTIFKRRKTCIVAVQLECFRSL